MISILQGDCLEVLRTMESESIHCCVTSPPYYGLRDYGVDGQIGLEPTPAEYVEKMCAVFREVRRVLREDGTCWVNLGDSYASSGRSDRKESPGVGAKQEMKAPGRQLVWESGGGSNFTWYIPDGSGGKIKQKDLLGIPWRVAFALQADGWYLRQDIIWHKPNPMPESVTDRCTKAHEYIFLLSKSARYWYDAEAIKEASTDPESLRPEGRSQRNADRFTQENAETFAATRTGFANLTGKCYTHRNRRSVWTVSTHPYSEAHFATFPPDLIKPCILAGCPVGGVVLDPFGGSGTTGMVAVELGRKATLIELNPEYVKLAETRTNVTPGLPI